MPSPWRALSLATLITASLIGCGDDEIPSLSQPADPLDLPAGCQPLLGGHDCLLPYPSDWFRVEDPSLPTGYRIETTGAARLQSTAGKNADVNTERPIDGFSQVPVIVAAFPAELSPEGLPKLADDPEKSRDAASPTLLIDAATGERIPHFVDLDPRAIDPSRQALVIHPIVGLKPETRYVVAIRGLKQKDGAEVPAPEGFRRLRDAELRGDGGLAAMADHYEAEVFPIAMKAGAPRAALQLAWDFTTGSVDDVTADMLRIRELTLAWLDGNTPAITVTQVEADPSPDVWRRIHGEVAMPLFLDATKPGSRLHRDAAGKIAQNGVAKFPFVAQVPASVRDRFEPGRALAYGHGFFGGIDEVEGGSARKISDGLGAVVFATEWWGMAKDDVSVVADGLSGEPATTFVFTDRVHQAMANWLVLTRAIQGPMRQIPELARPNEGVGVSEKDGVSNAGAVLFEEGAPVFLGISQGHILGGTMSALNPDLARVALNVGGAGFTQVMMRANPFKGFLTLLDISMHDPLDQQKFIATMQRPFDRIDPATYGPMLLADKLPGSPPDRRVLMQMGLGDTQVPNLGSYLHARIVGLPVITPSPVIPWGIEPVPSPHDGSALAIYDFGIDDEALYSEAIPPESVTEVHNTLRALGPTITQMDAFFREGKVVNACSGVCDPE